MTQQAVLITGCSSGFGRLTAKRFAAEGWNVIATMRAPERETELTTLADVVVLELDVCNQQQIDRAVAFGLERFGAIDVAVNNAGFGGSTLFEHVSDDAIRAMYDTNVFGVMNVTRTVLPHMRQRGSGRVINVTSANGFLGSPTLSIYCSTKFAVDGFTESLAHEYEPLGIQIKTVQPGAFPTTDFGSNSRHHVEQGDELAVYRDFLLGRLGAAIGGLATGHPPNEPKIVADKIYECATGETPIHNPVGADANQLADMMSSMPRHDFLDHVAGLLFPERHPGSWTWDAALGTAATTNST